MKYCIPALLALSLLSACSSSSDEVITQAEPNYHYVFTSVGYAPIEAQKGASFDLKILNAIKASKLEAYREMAEQVYGVLVTSDNSVEGSVLQNDKIKAEVKGLVRGARVLKSYHENDVYITELELDMTTLPFLKVAAFNERGGSVIRVDESVYY